MTSRSDIIEYYPQHPKKITFVPPKILQLDDEWFITINEVSFSYEWGERFITVYHSDDEDPYGYSRFPSQLQKMLEEEYNVVFLSGLEWTESGRQGDNYSDLIDGSL